MYRTLTKRGTREVFRNVEIAGRIYLTLMVSSCLKKRSFSASKRIKSLLRSAMNDRKLNNLSIINIEVDILRKVDFQDVVKEFASCKCRKPVF